MTESTSNHNWTIPEVGGSKDVWGQILNDFFDDELDEEVSLKGPFSERPSAGGGVAKLYLATDRRIVYYNDGTSWEAVYGLGTEDNPVPDTSHFESIQADGLNITAVFKTASDDEDFDDALSSADEGDRIVLANTSFDGRTIDDVNQLSITGTGHAGTELAGDWGFNIRNSSISHLWIVNNKLEITEPRNNISNIRINGNGEILLTGSDTEDCVIDSIIGDGSVTLGSDTSSNTVGAVSGRTDVTDNGNNNIL